LAESAVSAKILLPKAAVGESDEAVLAADLEADELLELELPPPPPPPQPPKLKASHKPKQKGDGAPRSRAAILATIRFPLKARTGANPAIRYCDALLLI
jgi:hypothetical protein